jgi:hypothetical protein
MTYMPNPAFLSLRCRHQCLIYQGAPSRHLPALIPVLKHNLEKNYRCLYLDSPPMIAGMRCYLSAAGIDVEVEVAKGRLLLSSDQRHLDSGKFSVNRMLRTLNDAVQQSVLDGFNGLWATGDMTWEFGPDQNFSKLVEYECKLEDFIRQNPEFSGICIYHAETLPCEAVRHGLTTHRSLFFNETLSRINPHFVAPELRPSYLHDSAALDAALRRIFHTHTHKPVVA